MATRTLDRTTKTALGAAGVLFFLAGVGWALYGDDVFVATVMAGLAGCF
jgi:hypothetical protein